MKRTKKIFVAIVSLSMLFSISSHANTISWSNVPGNYDGSVLLSETVLTSSDEYRTIARGDFLSSGISQISNRQDGSIEIDIDTYAHHNVDRIFHTVFLDQWDEDDQDWYQVNSWNFVKSKEEMPNGELSMLLTSFTVTGYETGKYYRVRGLHGVEYNDEVEACATETHGVLITDGPT